MRWVGNGDPLNGAPGTWRTRDMDAPIPQVVTRIYTNVPRHRPHGHQASPVCLWQLHHNVRRAKSHAGVLRAGTWQDRQGSKGPANPSHSDEHAR